MAERFDPFLIVTDPTGYQHPDRRVEQPDPAAIGAILVEPALAIKYARAGLADCSERPGAAAVIRRMLEDARSQISAAIDAIIEYEETKG